MMRLRGSTLAMFVVVLGLTAPRVVEAQNTSQVFGRATDASGAVLPGVTVTLSSQALLEPRVAVTGETGSYEFSGLPIGVYAVRFELSGFSTLVRDGLQLQSGFNAQVNGELTVGALQENVIVTGVTPYRRRPQHDARDPVQRRGIAGDTLGSGRVPGADADAGHHRGPPERWWNP